MRRTQPSTNKAKFSSTNHVQLVQWLQGKQQQHGGDTVDLMVSLISAQNRRPGAIPENSDFSQLFVADAPMKKNG